MNLDDALIRLQLVLNNLKPLDWYQASVLVNHWFAPVEWAGQRLADVMAIPVIGYVAVPFAVALWVTAALLATLLEVILLFGSSVVACLADAAAPFPAHAIAVGWAIWHALGGG
jgi:hypothetical protein